MPSPRIHNCQPHCQLITNNFVLEQVLHHPLPQLGTQGDNPTGSMLVRALHCNCTLITNPRTSSPVASKAIPSQTSLPPASSYPSFDPRGFSYEKDGIKSFPSLHSLLLTSENDVMNPVKPRVLTASDTTLKNAQRPDKK